MFNIPKLSISISISSPSFRYTAFGLFNITPAGVPVEIISPFSNVITFVIFAIISGILILADQTVHVGDIIEIDGKEANKTKDGEIIFGVGLENLQRRLNLLYLNNHQLSHPEHYRWNQRVLNR